MKTVKENFQEFKKRLGTKLFNELYRDKKPRTFKVVKDCGDEICILQPFDFHNEGTKFLKIWTKRNQYIE